MNSSCYGNEPPENPSSGPERAPVSQQGRPLGRLKHSACGTVIGPVMYDSFDEKRLGTSA